MVEFGIRPQLESLNCTSYLWTANSGARREATEGGRQLNRLVGLGHTCLDLSELIVDRPISLQPQDCPGEGGQPRLVKGSTTHLHATGVIGFGPLEEFDVPAVQLPTFGDRLAPIPHNLALPPARQANRSWNGEEHNQLELRDERVAPATE